MKKRVGFLFLSLLLVAPLFQFYATFSVQYRQGESENRMSVCGADSTSPQEFVSEQYSNYLGGSSDDELAAIVFVEPNIVYLAGTTSSTDFPASGGYQDTNAGLRDCFIMKLNIATDSVIYSTYIGGAGDDILTDIVVDDDGNVYATGTTESADFPIVSAYTPIHNNPLTADAFALKLNPTGTNLVYSTFFGCFGIDSSNSIDIDSEGRAYIFGNSYGGTIPLVNPIDDERIMMDSFLAIFNATGNGLDFSSYIGGSGDDYARSISLDDSEDIYLIGSTSSDNLDGLTGYDTSFNGGLDCYIMKIASTLSEIDRSTYVGGSGMEEPMDAFVDGSGVVYVTGYTTSTDFPIVDGIDSTRGGSMDCIVFALSAIGDSIMYSTYLGGSAQDLGNGILADSNEAIYVTGDTQSDDFPTTSGVDKSLGGSIDGFVSKINLTTDSLEYSSYVGGSDEDHGECIALDSNQNIIVAGYTDSTDFLTESTNNGMNDWFVYEILKPEPSSPPIMTGIILAGIVVIAIVFVLVVVGLRRR